MKQWLTLFFLEYVTPWSAETIYLWEAFDKTRLYLQIKNLISTNKRHFLFIIHTFFLLEKTNRDSRSNMQKHVLLLQECCWWSTPFICSIQGMNCAENSLDSWTCPRSCNKTYCGQTERVLNCTREIIKLFSAGTENNWSLVRHSHTSAHSHEWTQSVVYVWNSTLSY